MAKYGITYMGSKAKIAASLALNFPTAENFYDLFGGGFSMTHYMLENKDHRYNRFFYNEIKSDIVDLVKRAIAGEYSYKVFKPKWISRDDFFANLDDHYIKVIWSFGNNQRSYLFGRDIEHYKKSMHNAVVFDEFDDFAIKVLGFKKWPSNVNTFKKRRFYFRQKVVFDNKGMKRGDLQRLEQLEQLQQLERLQQLQQLQQLEQLPKLNFSSLDYRKVEILPNSVIYCDPPYAGTADYGNQFNSVEFLNWAANIKSPVYISEYQIKDPRFELVYSVDKRSLLSSDKTVGDKAERLYWNGVSL